MAATSRTRGRLSARHPVGEEGACGGMGSRKPGTNNLGGSHPAGVFEVAHQYDEAVAFLLDYKIGGIPLPDYILLKSAHDILEAFDYWKKR